MDIWHFIARDQANIAHLIHEMPAALPGSDVLRSRGRLLADLIDEFERHATALSDGLYPMLRRDRGMARLLGEFAEDEAAARQALHGLRRQRTDRKDWLAQFADASYAVDRWLHGHRHELVPAARGRLFGPDLERATEAFIRARRRSLAPSQDLFAERLLVAGAAVALISALALLVRRYATPDSERARRPYETGRTSGRGRSLADRAADAIPRPRHRDEDLHARQERLLDEAIEETFPASDPIAPKRITP